MTNHEYSVVQLAAGGRIGQFNERLTSMVEEGWEPFLMSGDTHLNVMLRREIKAAPAQPQAAPPA